MTSRSAFTSARLERLVASDCESCPPEIKSLIDRVIQSPLQDIGISLTGFKWDYNKGNFRHWEPLFLHFDTFFKTYLSNRRDLLLCHNIAEDDNPFPKNTVLQILRVMQIILENCPNKSSFTGLEHFKLLLSSTDPEVLMASLETLAALVNINPSKVHGNAKLIGLGLVNNCLMSLAQGWGSKEDGLGLYFCVLENEKSHNEELCLSPSDTVGAYEPSSRLGSTLYFDLHCASSDKKGGSSSGGSSSTTSLIHIPDMHLRKEDDLLLMKHCIEHYNVPEELRFSLLTRIRYTKAFRTPRIFRLYCRIYLLSLIVLIQSHDANDQLTSFYVNEPDFPNELIRIVRSEETIPGTIRTLAMQALSAQIASNIASYEHRRIFGGFSINFSRGNREIFLNVLQKAIISLSNSNDGSSLAFVEAILQFYLLHVISSLNNGGSTDLIRWSGIVPIFLPLLKDMIPSHIHLVCSAVKTLQKLMCFSRTTASLFESLGGVEMLAQRLETEVQAIIVLAGPDENSMVVGEVPTLRTEHMYTQKRLIKALLKALGNTTHTLANSSREDNTHDNIVPSTLALIFSNVDKFGGDIYSSAATLMSRIIHNHPTCFTALHEAGLPHAFLTSVLTGIHPSSKALTCVPLGLEAICKNAKGLEAVKNSSALRFLVDIFTLKKYVMAMNEAILPLATAVEKLLKHVSSLRNSGVDVIIEIVNKISMLGNDNLTSVSGLPNSSTAMETDTEDKVKDDTDVSNEQFIQLCIFHGVVLVQRAIKITETCRLFVEKSGTEALLKLFLRPSIRQSSSGMPVDVHSTMVIRGFTRHLSVQLASSFCSALKDQLKKVLNRLHSMSGSFLLDPLSTSDEVFLPLFIVEFLLFLAASKDDRWVNALLDEFGNGSKDVLIDIGQLHREMLWQIALLEDAKVAAYETDTISAAEVHSFDSNRENERLTSFRQYLDPLSRRRMSGWSAESHFIDPMNLNHASIQQRLGPPNTRFGLSNPLQQPNTETLTADISNKDKKQSSYYASCCEMVRSLSTHISHLFQELGKAVVSPHIYNDSINVSSSAKLVVSTFATIAQDHMAFRGHGSPSSFEVSISTKCRYLGKVIDFIDGIVLERPGSCNPFVLNSLYGQGVLQSVLTTFEATSQLLFAVNRVPTSPMELDDGSSKLDERVESDCSWIHGPLGSYGKLMDHLVTSVCRLSSSTKKLLCQPTSSSDIPFPRDAETFVKVLQAMVMKAVLPVWLHAKFTDCDFSFITTVISIIKHVYSGREVKTTGDSSTRLSSAPPNETAISTLVELGFTRSRAEEALRQEAPQLPHIDQLLETCTRLLQLKEPLAFHVRDLFVTLFSQNDGQFRSNIITFITKQIKHSNSNIISSGDNTLLSVHLHVLALIFHEDAVSREVAVNSGFIKLTLDLLSKWDSGTCDVEGTHVPKWVTTAFLAIDRLLQVDQNISELLNNGDRSKQNSIVIDEDSKSKLQSSLGLSPNYIDVTDQKRVIEIACNCMRKHPPSDNMHAVLQLCAFLTRTHSVAVSFLEAGGISLLLLLPISSLFEGFDTVAASIIRHVLEDPQTLQQAMESEIRNSLGSANNRHYSGRIRPKNFLMNLSPVISRDPAIFFGAAQAVCQVEMEEERPYIVLTKNHEKNIASDKDKSKSRDGNDVLGNMNPVGPGHGQGKLPVSVSKNSKIHRKPPKSFVNTVELLIESATSFLPPKSTENLSSVAGEAPPTTDMDVDVSNIKGKGKTVFTEERRAGTHETQAAIARTVFVLKLLTEMVTMYTPTIQFVLQRDAEISSYRGSQKVSNVSSGHGVLHHLLHEFLTCSRQSKKDKNFDGDWRQKLVTRANHFIVTCCVRSSEARKRVFQELSFIFNDFVDSCGGPLPPGSDIQAFVDLVNDVIAARSLTGSYISAEASATFINVGLVKCLTQTLRILDLDHADSAEVVSGIVVALERVTKEHVIAAGVNTARGDTNSRHVENDTVGRTEGSVSLNDIVEDDDGMSEEDEVEEHNDLSEEEEDHRMPHPDQDDHEVDDDRFDQDVMEEDEDDEDDENEVFGRDRSFGNDSLRVMPIDVFRLRRQDRTTSIYNLIDMNGGNPARPRHPLLVEPSPPLHSNLTSHSDIIPGSLLENESRLDAAYSSLRNGLQGKRLNVWADDHRSSSSTVFLMPQGFQDLFVSSLKRPLDEASDSKTSLAGSQSKIEDSMVGNSKSNARETNLGNYNANNGSQYGPPSVPALNTSNVELTVGGQVARSRRPNVSSGNLVSASGREAPLHSLTGVSENPSQEDMDVSTEAQSGNYDPEARPIDTVFLEALPEELIEEVVSSQQNQASQPSNTEQPNPEEIDPEFLAALPPDIRAEVLAKQQAQRRHQSQELEGQPLEMDTVSIDATFPSDIREEVLSTSSDAFLANLTPAPVAEGNMIRERFANRYNYLNLFDMYHRRRRGESSRRRDVTAFDRAGGVLAMRNSSGGKVVEAGGAPLVDPKALESMIRVLRVVQPLHKGPYQMLLLNLCAHSDTRQNLVRLLMNMLTMDIRKPINQAEAYQPIYRLYSGQSHMLYSRPQYTDGIPPLLSRRILEVLTYLVGIHRSVAKSMLNLMIPWSSTEEVEDAESGRDKITKITGNYENLDNQQPDEYVPVVLLFSLLNQPLYLRSVVHLEHLLHLLEVVIENAEAKSKTNEKAIESATQQPSAQALVNDTDMNVEPVAASSMDVSLSTMADGSRKPFTSIDKACDDAVVLGNLPQAELRLLCSLLAREGLPDSVSAHVAEVVKKLAVITPAHSQLFLIQLTEAVQSLTISAIKELHLYGESKEALLCTSFFAAAVLRVLQALSSIVSSSSVKEAGLECVTENKHIFPSKMCDISSALEPLWLELSSCISKIEGYSDSTVASSSLSLPSKSKPSGSTPLPAGSHNILPYIESFFLMCEKLPSGHSGTGADTEDLNSPGNPPKPSSCLRSVEKHVSFVKFTERHRKLLNAFIHENPGLLKKSFSLMLKVPRFIDFDNKCAHFRSKTKHRRDHNHSSLSISVRRAYILEDSYNQLRMRSSQDLKGSLTVHFKGEAGIDAGGLTREWYQLLSRVIFDRGALLFTTVGNDWTFQPNPNSVYQTKHLSYFKFVGRVVGKALFDAQLLDVHFTRSFYKHILGAKVTYHDIEAIDPDYFKNLKWMLENDISDVLDLTFSVDADEEKLILYEKNEVTDTELIPGGRNIKVTQENKHQYVDLIAEHRLTKAIRPQINAFLEGFTELIPRELISIFNDKELELLISGLPDIDLDDMRANTLYSGYRATSPVIQWFWEVAQSFSKEDKARFLQFVTGTSKVPLEGFSASGSQKFHIHKAYDSVDRLPSAYTCSNQLNLPKYPSKDHLKERLLLAIHEGSEGFAFG